ncbi:flagellar hook capping FlgD N-terminal domain-containing protein [Paenibacillus spongiae]|uniref:Flagellar hook capping protein n=1 Tax=Paenibacillus spongiae TaxID=2909671 RepID=A0ABY5SEV0_9BACL|nr:flagellar hook capping FlgD N-terminal domain-containing protein [Paenibacillus spongiae]UVI32501.1 flagellar hook capping protein [Paenibacillus spongiae]
MASDSVSTRNVWPYYDKSNVQMAAEKKKDNNSLGKDDFLRILVTQLRNQDPMQPLQDSDFIAQMAQFTSVEQLMNMSNEMTMLRQNLGMASSMIGKEIAWYDYTETGELVPFSGKVESILIKDNVQYAIVGESQIPLDKIVSIAEGGETSDG